MHKVKCYSSLWILLSLISVRSSWGCSKPARTIIVDQSQSGQGFKTIQSAIDSIPFQNTQWIHIQISAGTYIEKVTIPREKPCIFLEGAGSTNTSIEWHDHQQTNASATFSSWASDIGSKGISIVNTYNSPPRWADRTDNVTQAVAALVAGDRTFFYECAFRGVQDTLWDCTGRHYFYNCYIEGAIDFIFGNGQSIYEESTINYTKREDSPQGFEGFITAQGRASMDETTGFVFNKCNFVGVGKTYLGRAWRSFARVIIANSYMDNIIDPLGWVAWNGAGNEKNLIFVEEGNKGAGANKSKRVSWLKHMGQDELVKFLNVSYFIDQGGWMPKLPIKS